MTDIIQACRDPNLFSPWFQKNPQSWDAWHAALAALFGLPMTAAQLAIFTQCAERPDIPRAPFREAWFVCGRRGGKSFALALIAVFLAAFHDYKRFLAPGERGSILVIAQDRKQARNIFNFIRGFLTGVPMLRNMLTRETADAFDLDNQVSIEIIAASYRSTRGYTVVAALCDEISFWPTGDSVSPDYDVLNAIRPGMLTIPNSMLLCASSPYAQKGALYDAHRKHFGQPNARVLVWQAATRVMNPSVPQEEIDAEYERDPQSAASEYGALFRTDISALILGSALDAVVARSVHERAPISTIKYSAFIDPSGGSSDSMTLAISHAEGDIAVLDAIREVRPPFSPAAVVAEFADCLRLYHCTSVTGDRYGGEWCREPFRKLGIAYDLSEKSKSEIYLATLPIINSRRCDLLDHKRLHVQLLGLERRTARGGRDSIDHAPGAHDDVANAAMGALVLAAAPRQETSTWIMTPGSPPMRIRSERGNFNSEIDRRYGRGFFSQTTRLRGGY
jgi:hypothetical protein